MIPTSVGWFMSGCGVSLTAYAIMNIKDIDQKKEALCWGIPLIPIGIVLIVIAGVY